MKKLLFVIALIIFSGCGGTNQNVQGVETHTDIGKYGDLYTVEHDGHDFVVYDGYKAGGFTHHPDCPKCK